MDNLKTLSISIPTWNRFELLQELLIQLINQIELYKLNDDIEIVVSDNCSSDATESTVLKLCSKYNYIKYFKNNTNLGAKTNVINSLFLANGKFALLLGDDDRIRENCLAEIVDFLKSHPKTSILLDQSKSRYQLANSLPVSLENLLTKFYWLMGNAGFFICSTKYLKYNIEKYGIEFFNECWPQTQLMILGNLLDNGELYVLKIAIPTESKHGEVMVYNSFYLWRTCILELLNASHTIKSEVPSAIYDACRQFMIYNIKQVFFNIMQCGLFVDHPSERRKTQIHISKHINLFTFKERIYLKLIILIFKVPTVISRPLSNIFILLTKGVSGLEKKKAFVNSEQLKRQALTQNISSVRMLDFEK